MGSRLYGCVILMTYTKGRFSDDSLLNTGCKKKLGQSFFIFRFTDPPDPFFWKLKKKIKEIFFNFIFLFPSDTCQYSTGVQLCFFVLSFLLLPG